MGFLDKAKWVWDRDGTMKSLIEKWRPRKFDNEKEFEQSLQAFLRRELPDDIDGTPQYAQGRFRADIRVGKDVVIEIKYNLDTTSKLQRLMGQVETYEEWKGTIFLVLTGKTDQDLKSQLTSYLKKRGMTDSLLLTQTDKGLFWLGGRTEPLSQGA